jgi:conjugal transfer ATP-binding protein TraC
MLPGIRIPDENEVDTGTPKKSFFSRSSKRNTENDDLYQKGLATLKDLIAPPAIKLTTNSLQVGEVLTRTYFVIAYPRFLSTNWFSPVINIDFAMDIALYIHPIDTGEILKDLRKSATQVQSQLMIEAEDGKIRNPVLETAMEDIEGLRDKLQQATERARRISMKKVSR